MAKRKLSWLIHWNKLRESRVWDYLAWICLFGIALWVILKMLGVIRTSFIVEYSPLLGAIYLAGWAMQKLDRATDDITEIKKDLRDVESDMNNVRTEVTIIKNNCTKSCSV